MRLSDYFLPLLKEDPADAAIASHRLMLRAGMVRQLTSGIYSWLPLGLKVLQKIEAIIRDEMQKAGCMEVLMPTIQPAELWKESGRYDAYGKEMLRISDRHEHAMLYGPTNEEVVTDIFRKTIRSYKDLPKNFFHIQWKFRDEIRPRFGVMRGREFLMKDAYSFDIDFESAKASYQHMFKTYLKIFRRLGLTVIPVRAESGAIGGDLSNEFHVVADTGESEIFYDPAFDSLIDQDDIDLEKIQSLYAAADEMHDPERCPIPEDKLQKRRGIEVGHIFHFGTKYSEPFGAVVTNKDGKPVPVEGGSYGIGISRLVGAIIEAFHDDSGIIWPKVVAPFQVGLINIKPGHDACDVLCEEIYTVLSQQGVEVLYDDRKESTGVKFATQDLIGTPWHLTVGPRGAESRTVELKERVSGEKVELSLEAALSKMSED